MYEYECKWPQDEDGNIVVAPSAKDAACDYANDFYRPIGFHVRVNVRAHYETTRPEPWRTIEVVYEAQVRARAVSE